MSQHKTHKKAPAGASVACCSFPMQADIILQISTHLAQERNDNIAFSSVSVLFKNTIKVEVSYNIHLTAPYTYFYVPANKVVQFERNHSHHEKLCPDFFKKQSRFVLKHLVAHVAFNQGTYFTRPYQFNDTSFIFSGSTQHICAQLCKAPDHMYDIVQNTAKKYNTTVVWHMEISESIGAWTPIENLENFKTAFLTSKLGRSPSSVVHLRCYKRETKPLTQEDVSWFSFMVQHHQGITEFEMIIKGSSGKCFSKIMPDERLMSLKKIELKGLSHVKKLAKIPQIEKLVVQKIALLDVHDLVFSARTLVHLSIDCKSIGNINISRVGKLYNLHTLILKYLSSPIIPQVVSELMSLKELTLEMCQYFRHPMCNLPDTLKKVHLKNSGYTSFPITDFKNIKCIVLEEDNVKRLSGRSLIFLTDHFVKHRIGHNLLVFCKEGQPIFLK